MPAHTSRIRSAEVTASGALLLRRGRATLTGRISWPPSPTGPTVLLVGPGPWADGDALGASLSHRAGAVVISVPWRPGADAVTVEDVLGWVAEHATEIDGDPDRLVLVGLGAAVPTVAAAARRAASQGWPRLLHHVLIPSHPAELAAEPAAEPAAVLTEELRRTSEGDPS